MLKQKALKKIFVATLALIIASILYLFPSSNSNSIKEEVSFHDIKKDVIYIPDKYDYVARTSFISKENDVIKKIKEILSYLTIQNENNNYLPNIFNPIIPKNTKILNIDLQDGLLKINFSKELLNIKEKDEIKLLESITYSLTELKEVDNIMIFVENNILDKLPNSNKRIPILLNRSIGINKIYDLNDIKNTSTITTYYLAKDNNLIYYVPISKITNNNEEKIEVIIKELKTMPIYQTNLISFLKANASLLNYEILDDKISLSFNNYIFDDFNKKNILEEVKYSIGLSINDSYNLNTVLFYVDNRLIDEYKT